MLSSTSSPHLSQSLRVKTINTRRDHLAHHLTKRDAHIVGVLGGVRMRGPMVMRGLGMMTHHLTATQEMPVISNIRLVPISATIE
jgi:hypothetical protein